MRLVGHSSDHSRRRPPSAERGAVLIVALIIMAVLALGLTSYLSLNLSSARLAQRSYQQNAAFNLAEAGAEEALWSLNRANSGMAEAWAEWKTLTPGARRELTGFQLGSATGRVQVYIDNHQPTGNARPSIVAMATVESPGSGAVTKMIEVNLRRRSRFSAGLLAKESVTFAGRRASVDSWNSDPDNDPATAPVAYSEAVRNDGGSVASIAVGTSAVLVNQAAIYGYVYTGGAQPDVGHNGSITGRHTPAGVKIDTSRVATNFTATFADVTAPVDGTVLAAVGSTLGTPGQATKWRTTGISLSGQQTLTIYGDVTLILTGGSGSDAIDVTGQAAIFIAENSSLTVYLEGDAFIGGNGLGNANARPAACQIYGTNRSAAGQSLQVAGNGTLKAAIYAPNAHVKINGNGSIMGAIVARNITLTGEADFHYDESLQEVNEGMPFGVHRWRELTTDTQRASHAEKFADW